MWLDAEIDLIGIGEKDNLFCEVKWSDNGEASSWFTDSKRKPRGSGSPGNPISAWLPEALREKRREIFIWI